jgi:hypothetical protein
MANGRLRGVSEPLFAAKRRGTLMALARVREAAVTRAAAI